MDSHSHHPNTIVRNGVITVEQYHALTDSHKTEDLTVNQLNQIVAMHGFTKIKSSKKVIIDAVNSLDLMSLTRSTLKENIHSSVNIKGDEAITDLNILKWQECTVTSIQLINSLDDQNSNHSQSCLQIPDRPKFIKAKTKPKQQVKYDDGSDVPSSSINEEAPIKENPKPKKKLKSVSDVPYSSIDGEAPINEKPKPKKKIKSVFDVPSSSINEAPIKEKPKPKKKIKPVSDAPSSSLTEVSKSDSVGTPGSGGSVEKKPKGGNSVEKTKSENAAEKPKSRKRKSLHMKSING